MVGSSTSDGMSRKRSARALVRGTALVGAVAVLGAGVVTATALHRSEDGPSSALTEQEQLRRVAELVVDARMNREYDALFSEYSDWERAHAQQFDADGHVKPSTDRVERRSRTFNTTLGCNLDGGEGSGRLHEGRGEVDLTWCTVPADRDQVLALANAQFGCYLDGGKWTASNSPYPDLESADRPFVLVPKDDGTVRKYTGTCVLPLNGERRVEQVPNPNITTFDAARVRETCSASGGHVSGAENTAYPRETVFCTFNGETAVRDRFTLARFATACWMSGGTFSDTWNGYPRVESVEGTCRPYV